MRGLGILPANYRIGQLSDSQKRHVRRLEQKLRSQNPELVNKPEKYLSGRVSARNAAKLSEQGYGVRRTNRGWVFFAERQHSNRVRFNPRQGTVTREYFNRKNRTYPFDDAPETLARIEKFFKNKKPNEYLTFRVGDKAPFNITISTRKDFEKYKERIREEWENREGKQFAGEGKEYHTTNPWTQLQIVEVESNETKKATRRKSGGRSKVRNGARRKKS